METILIKGQVPLPIDREIRDRLESGHADSFLMIVPTAHARRKWQCECLQYAPNRAAAGLHIHTLEDLVRRFYGRLGSTRRQVSEGLQTVWMRQIIDGLELPFLKPHAEIPVPQGTVTRLTGAINQLKASGITPSQLQGDLVQSELVERGKLADLIAIYEAYERRLGDEWIDRAGLHHAVSSHLSSAGTVMRSIFPNVEMVIVRGFDVFSPPDLSMLTGIADLPQIGMGIRLDFDAQNESLFGHVKESYAQLLNCGFREINEKLVQETTDASFNFQAENRNRHFAQNLFRKDRWLEQSAEKLELTDQISLLGVSDRVQEVEQIAGLINQLVLDQPDLDLHRICVTCYDLSIYAPLMREIFPLYGIPHALDWGNALAHSPLVTSIFSLLDFIAGMASPRNRCKILRSPYFHFDQTIEEVMVQCQFNTQMTPDTFRTAFGQLLATLRVRQQILNHGRDSRDQTQPSIIKEEIDAYRAIRALVNELVEFLTLTSEGDGRHPLTVYVSWLRLMVSQTTAEAVDSALNTGGVSVLPLVRTKELDFEVVILCGLVDGEFPAIFRSDAFLHAKRRRTESDRLREDRFLFYQALKCFRRHLYLIVPAHDGEIELVQSTFVDELRRVAEIEELEDDNTTLFSTERFLKHYGKFVWEQSEDREAPSLPSAIAPALRLIAHNVRVEKSRTVTHELPHYEGWLTHDLLSPSSRRALEERRQTVHSVSWLESYGQCPFQYFSHRLLSLNRIEEEEEEGLTEREKGNRLHKILFEFYDRRRDGPPISAYTDSEFETAVQELKQIAQKHLGQAHRGGLFWEIEMETLIGGHGRKGVLPAFLEAERARKLEAQPRYFEVEFGLSGGKEWTDARLGSDLPIPVGDVSLSGRIDRIEMGNGFFIVGDYKTGSVHPKIGDILEGRSLQLPIYLTVVEQLMKRHHVGEVRGIGGVYYVLREGGKADLGIGEQAYNGRGFKASSRNGQLVGNVQEIINLSVEYVNRYVRSISSGEFPLTSHDTQLVCRSCSFKKICRVGVIGEEDQ